MNHTEVLVRNTPRSGSDNSQIASNMNSIITEVVSIPDFDVFKYMLHQINKKHGSNVAHEVIKQAILYATRTLSKN